MNTTPASLHALRSHFSDLARAFANRYGPESEPCLRAEQVAAALQRLEWALARCPQAAMSQAAAASG